MDDLIAIVWDGCLLLTFLAITGILTAALLAAILPAVPYLVLFIAAAAITWALVR